jgi:hypothetical protein
MSKAWPEPEGGYIAMLPDPDPTEDELDVGVDQQQLQLFKISKRWSPAHISVYLLLPDSQARTHMVACAMGNAKRRDGTFAPARDGKDVIGVLIPYAKRKQVCTVLEIELEYFSRIAKHWEDLHIAHRCARGVVCLWLDPLMEQCPGCNKQMDVSARETDQSVQDEPDNQSNETGQSVQQIVPISRDAMRDESRDADSEPWFLKKKEMLERLKNLDGYKEELAAREAEDE